MSVHILREIWKDTQETNKSDSLRVGRGGWRRGQVEEVNIILGFEQ